MRFGSLFAGIGGIDLGLEQAGMECIWQVEIDEYCQRVLEKHWPKVKRYGDVRGVGKHNLETVDLIAGGFPCQPHSVAGKRKGATDDRNLWPEFSRVIAELKPRFVLAENVPGIITTYLDTVLSDLEGKGYTCAILNLPAVAFDAPHRRERIFIVAWYPNGRNGNKGKIKKMAEGEDTQSSGIRADVSHPSAVLGLEIKRDEQDGILSEDVSDTDRVRQLQSQGGQSDERGRIGNESWWRIEPDVGRVAHGIPSRVDRLRGLGNAVVPQVAEWIGHRIMAFDND